MLPRYSMGIGDRFGRQGAAQLRAFTRAAAAGVAVTPVWNKSNREHAIIGTAPAAVRDEADAAVRDLDWDGPYFVDADHIGLGTVDRFIGASDFFTLDVADFTGRAAPEPALRAFVERHARFAGELAVPGLAAPLRITRELIERVARKYLLAVVEAGRIYRHVAAAKGPDAFVPEVSMDETDEPQTPVELLLILAAVADEGIPAQTVAPKFSGRFNKGVDYVGDPAVFTREFEDDVCVIAFAVREFGLPANLKLSVHSGSDKFSLYPRIRDVLARHGAGVHLKTAGTTWLEELIGLAESGGAGLAIARRVYREALGRFEELCRPYATVIDIDRAGLPAANEVDGWDGARFAAALRHDPSCAAFNPNLRQLLHVGYKVAAELGAEYLGALDRHAAVIGAHVETNIYTRHLSRVFPGLA